MKLKTLISLSVVIIALVGIIIYSNKEVAPINRNNNDNLKSFARNSDNFCQEQQEIAYQLLAQDNPTSYIKKSPQFERKYLELWKFLMMRHNDISEEYFDKHIRIRSYQHYDGVNNQLNGDNVYFDVNYFYILDWVVVYQNDRFTTDKSIEEIKEFFSITNNPDVENPKNDYYNSLNFVRDIRIDNSLVTPLNCDSALKELEKIPGGLVPTSFGFQRDKVVMFADNVEKNCFSGNASSYKYIEMSVSDGSVIFNRPTDCPM